MTLGPDIAAPGPPGPVAERRRAARAFAGWLVGASILTGVVRVLETEAALSHFGMEDHIGLLLALSALRVDSASVATAAASVALVVATHGRSQAGPDAWRALPPWRLYAAVPLVTPVAACILMAAGVGTASVVYHVPAAVSWRGIREITNLSDPLVGIATECAFAAAVGALATFVGPRLAARPWGIVRKVLVALFVTGLVTGVLRGVADAILVPAAAPVDLGADVPGVGRTAVRPGAYLAAGR
jgi:ABC-type transporter Mla maintaining outer membrane lipid asymmetry permease subunit MlaE